jgi:predicted kinase
MKTVVIMRGLPGSGKSAVADLMQIHHRISMDHFWTKDGQPYSFNYSKLGEAIDWTHRQFISALEDTMTGIDLIVVDNVNYAKEHFQFFVDEAKKHGARVHFVHVERPLDELDNSHGVPEEKVLQMAEHWDHIL